MFTLFVCRFTLVANLKTEVVMNDHKMTPGERRAISGFRNRVLSRMPGMFMVSLVLTTYGMACKVPAMTPVLPLVFTVRLQAVFQIPFGPFTDRIGRKTINCR